MDISALIKKMDVIESNQPSIKKYLSESLYNTPEMQPHWKRIDEGFVKGYEKYLAEVALTPDQIQSIFAQASGGAAAGEAPKDPGKLAALVDKVLPSSQAANLEKTLPEPDAGPVQGFEQKAAAAVQNLQGADASTKQSLMQWIKQGVAKPETQQLILAAVGAGVGGLISKVGPMLSMIPGGGPVVAAVTGAIIAGAVSVASAKLQGKDWKTAFKGAIKPALMGGASAVIGNLAATAVNAMTSSGQSNGDMGGKAVDDRVAKGLPGASVGVGMELPDGEVVTSLNSGNPNSAVTITRPDGSTYSVSRDTVYSMTGQTGISPQATGPVSQGASSDPMAGVTDSGSKRGNSGWDSMKGNTNADGSPMTLDQINQAKADLRAGNASTEPAINRLTGKPVEPGPSWDQMTPDQQAATLATQQQQAADREAGAQNAKDYWANKPAYTRGLKESFAKSAYIDKQATLKMWLEQEARGHSVSGLVLKPIVKEGIMDFFKGKGKASASGVTADALNKAWAAAGNPTDSDEVAKVLQSAGVDEKSVSKIFADLGIEVAAPAGETVNIQELLAQISKLSAAEQKEILAYAQA
jgi:hypothetical protein